MQLTNPLFFSQADVPRQVQFGCGWLSNTSKESDKARAMIALAFSFQIQQIK